MTTVSALRLVFATVLLAPATYLAAEEPAPAPVVAPMPAAPAHVTLYTCWLNDSAWVDALTQYLNAVLNMPVSSARLDIPAGASADSHALLPRLAPRLPGEFRLLLVNDPAPVGEPSAEMDLDAATAIVHIGAWRPAGSDTDTDEPWRARVDRQLAASAAHLMGMPVCVLPLCVLNDSLDPHWVDQKARDMCPPCQEHFKRLQGLDATIHE